MFCSNCGCEITGAGRFCSECGAEQKNATPLNGTSVPNKTVTQMKGTALNATGTQWKAPVQGRTADNAGLSQQRPAVKTEFRINTAKTFRFLGTVLLIASFMLLMLMVLGAGMLLLEDEPDIIGMIVLVTLGIIEFAFSSIIALLTFTVGQQCIDFCGRQIVVKQLWGKQEYDCSDIVNIICGKYQIRYSMVYYISWMYGNKKRYMVNTGEEGFFEAAAYFHHMADIGVISQRAVTPETKEMLRRYAVKAW